MLVKFLCCLLCPLQLMSQARFTWVTVSLQPPSKACRTNSKLAGLLHNYCCFTLKLHGNVHKLPAALICLKILLLLLLSLADAPFEYHHLSISNSCNGGGNPNTKLKMASDLVENQSGGMLLAQYSWLLALLLFFVMKIKTTNSIKEI